MQIEQFTFTKFISTIAIVLFHSEKSLNNLLRPVTHKFLIHANYRARCSFTLSKFLMIIAYGRKLSIYPISYLKNKFTKIYPVHLLAIILSLIYINLIHVFLNNISAITLNLLVLQFWISSKAMAVNFLGWSISIECFFYAAFPIFSNRIDQKIKLKRLIFLILAFWLVSQVFFIISKNGNFNIRSEKENHNFLYYFPSLLLNQFLLENLAGLIFIRYFWNIRKKVDFAIIEALFLIILAILCQSQNISYYNELLAILLVPSMILIAMNSGFLTAIFNKQPLVDVGKISCEIYILQASVYWFIKYLILKTRINDGLKIFWVYITSLLSFLVELSLTEIRFRETIKKTIIN